MALSKHRQLAVKILQSLLEQQGSLSSLLDKLDSEIPQDSRSLLQASCYGACRHFHQLAALLDRLLDKPLRKKDKDIYCCSLSALTSYCSCACLIMPLLTNALIPVSS